MLQLKLKLLGPGRYLVPEGVDASNCIVFFNGRYLAPEEDYTVNGSVIEVSGNCLATDDLYIVETKPPIRKKA
jgi:hypothetical protein